MASAESLQKAADVYAAGLAAVAQMTPREAAEAAWYPGHPKSVDELEDQIRERRGLPPIDRAAARPRSA